MNEILNLNVVSLYFIYGLSFYTMGVAVALQYRSFSSFRLANSIGLLAAFALLHGISEWGSVFIPVKVPNFGAIALWKLIAIQRLLQSASYFFLFCFGVKLLADSRNQNFFWWFTLPTIAFVIWLVQFSRFVLLVGTGDLITWLLHSEGWSRYLLAFPAGVFTAYGLALQIREAEKLNDQSVLLNLSVATVAFGLFAFFSGLVGPYNIGWLSSMLNSTSFRNFTGIPIEVFRTITALLATVSITRLLVIFDLEKLKQVIESRRVEAVCLERERFARDLHDDVVQSIYGVGLDLQTTTCLIRNDNEKAARQITNSIKGLNEVILALRAYIQKLESNGREHDLKTMLKNLVEQFQGKPGPDLDFNDQLPEEASIQLKLEVEDWEHELRMIVREALNNVFQHAFATRTQVNISKEDSSLLIIIKDNGRGLPSGDPSQTEKSRKHYGIGNMKTRAKLLGGDLQLFSQPGDGTRVEIRLPLA